MPRIVSAPASAPQPTPAGPQAATAYGAPPPNSGASFGTNSYQPAAPQGPSMQQPYNAGAGMQPPFGGAPYGQPGAYGQPQYGQTAHYGQPMAQPYAPMNSMPGGGPALQEVLPGGASSTLTPGQGLTVTELKRSNPPAYQQALNALNGRQYTLAVDESGSMTTRDVVMVPQQAPWSRFRAVGEFASVLASTARKYDPDGLTILCFGNTVSVMNHVEPKKIQEIFQGAEPNLTTGTAMVSMLRTFKDSVLRDWRSGKKEAQTLLICTDGAPSRESNQEPNKEIAAIISELAVEICKMGGDDASIAISFVQVGEDAAVTQFLDYLDNDLGKIIAQSLRAQRVAPNGVPFTGEAFDIVDTKTLEQVKGMLPEDLLIDAMIN